VIAGLFALFLAGAVAAYFTSGKRSGDDRAATRQADDRAAKANANAGAPAGAPAQIEDVRATAAVPPSASPVDTGKAVNQVRDTVSRWNAALEARNLDAHMAYYAPRLHTYFLKDHVDRNTARAEVAAALSRYSKLKIETSPLAVSVDPSGDHAVATYEKRWEFEGKAPWSGAVIERLWLDRLNGRWRIAGVRDLKQIR
jgi:ketosteroid isomerase-like protein